MVPLAAGVPAIGAIKTLDLTGLSVPPVAGEVLPFTITIANRGTVSLSAIALADTLVRADGTALALSTGLTFASGDTGTIGQLDIA